MKTTTFRAKLLRRIGTTGTLLLGTLALQLGAQTFPNKPITIVLLLAAPSIFRDACSVTA